MKHTLVLAFFVLSIGEANPPPCSKVLSGINFSRETISEKLAEVPELRELILNVMDDPNISGNIKRIIKVALEDSDSSVLRLTDELRKEYGVPETHSAVAIHGYKDKSDYILVERTDGTASGNQALGKSMKKNDRGQLKSLYTVLVQEHVITEENNNLITLVHELSHIRFSEFFKKHIDRFASNFPADLVKKSADGRYEIDEQLYNYLYERYAFETEWQFLKESYGTHFFSWYKRYHPQIKSWSDQQVKEAICADVIVPAYGISDPRIQVLNSRSLSEIFMDGFK